MPCHIYKQEYWLRGLGLLACTLLVPTVGGAAEFAPINVGGSLGFNYRLFDSSGDQRTYSRQVLGALSANTYLWRPWFATTDLALTAALDRSDATSDTSSGYVSTDSNIISGTWNLNMLPQSRTPFNLRFSSTDTRVDNNAVDTDALVLFAGGDSKARKLSLQQSFIFDGGNRIFANYDNNTWYSERGGHYEDDLLTVQGELLGRGQRLTLNGRLQEATRSISKEKNENTFADVSHFYYPTSDLRVDSRASISHLDRSFDVPSDNTQRGPAISDIAQISSFFFYRPQQGRLTLSGGGRMFTYDGENKGTDLSNKATNVSGNLGAFYQYNKALRFDANVAYATTESNGITSDIMREHVGALYQSDLHLFRSLTYQWWANAALDNTDDDEGAEQAVNMTAAHTLYKNWLLGKGASARISGSQSLSQIYETRDNTSAQRLEQNLTAGWNQSAGGGYSLVQLTLTDRRNFGDDTSDQQFLNFQASRNQQLTRRNSLSGNVTIQRVLHDFGGKLDDSAITTATGRIDFQSTAVFGVPRLVFNSNWLLSRAADEGRVDRQEWGNRLDYVIGQLSTGLSHRYIRYDDDRYQLVFFRVERHF